MQEKQKSNISWGRGRCLIVALHRKWNLNHSVLIACVEHGTIVFAIVFQLIQFVRHAKIFHVDTSAKQKRAAKSQRSVRQVYKKGYPPIEVERRSEWRRRSSSRQSDFSKKGSTTKK